MSELLIALMVVSMFAVLLIAWRWFGDFRKAFIVMLVVGKTWAGVMWAFGFDRELFNVTLYNRLSGARAEITVTATELIFMSFLATLILTIFYPHIKRELGVEYWF